MVKRKLEEALNKTYEKVTDSYALAVKSVQNAWPLAKQIDKKFATAVKDHDFSKVSALAELQKMLQKLKTKI